MEQKVNVINPLELLNTVGQEVESVFAVKGKNVVDFMPIDKLRAKVKFSEREIAKLCKILGLDNEFATFIRNYQEDYAREKKKAAISFKVSKKAFTKLKTFFLYFVMNLPKEEIGLMIYSIFSMWILKMKFSPLRIIMQLYSAVRTMLK